MSIKKYLKLSLPLPEDLGYKNSARSDVIFGMSRSNWDVFNTEMKSMYPTAWLFKETIPALYCTVKHGIGNAIYYIRSHLQPSRRFHKLDLRQPNGEYSWGYRDVDARMLYAMFNLLAIYVEEEDPYCPSEQDIADDEWGTLQDQRDRVLEARALLHWWRVKRLLEQKEYKDVLHRWSEINRDDDKEEEVGDLWAELNFLEKRNTEIVLNKTIQLMKIRTGLWT